MKYTLTHCKLVDVADQCTIKDCSIQVENGRFTKIGSNVPAEGKTFDLEGQYIMPGLINLHAHLFGTGTPSKILAGGSAQKLVLKLAHTGVGAKVLDKLVAQNARNELLGGTTSVRAVGDFMYSDVRLRDKIRHGKEIGPRLWVSGPAITVPTGHGDGTFAVTATHPDGLRRLVRENVEAGVDLIKICVTGGVMDAKKKGEPGELKMNLDQTRAVCDEAHRLGKMVASHTESASGVAVAAQAGVDTIEHSAPFDPEDLGAFKSRGGAVIMTFSPALVLAKLPPELTKLNEPCVYNSDVVLQGMIASGKQCLAAGARVGMGTDASCPFTTQYNMCKEVYYFAKFLEVSNAVALRTATLGNAEIIGKERLTGSIETGKSADFIVMRENPVENLRALEHLTMVACRGGIIRNPVPQRSEKLEAELEQMIAKL